MSPRRAAILRGPHGHATNLRDHLVAAVDELLEREPIHGLTTRAIAHHAHVADGVLYNHFDTKSDLVIAALLRRFGRLVERLDAAVPKPGEGSVTANVQAFGRSLARMNGEAIAMGAGLLADPSLLHRFWTEIHRTPFGIARLRQPLVDYLSAERDLGRLAPDADIEALVTLVFGACALGGLAHHLGATAHPSGGHDGLDAALATALRGHVIGQSDPLGRSSHERPDA